MHKSPSVVRICEKRIKTTHYCHATLASHLQKFDSSGSVLGLDKKIKTQDKTVLLARHISRRRDPNGRTRPSQMLILSAGFATTLSAAPVLSLCGSHTSRDGFCDVEQIDNTYPMTTCKKCNYPPSADHFTMNSNVHLPFKAECPISFPLFLFSVLLFRLDLRLASL